jgi:4-hydroxyphenylacetate 3-monooxygenase
MGTRTGEELLEAMRDGRQLFIDGDRVEDVTTDPRFGAAARSPAQLYDMQHEPALIERMTFLSPTSGERVVLSFIEPRSIDDLIRRRDIVKIWADATCGMFGRSPDYMNIFITPSRRRPKNSARKTRASPRTSAATTGISARNDICMTHTLINPQVDRSRPVEKQDKDLAAKIVKETDAGIIIRGARMVSTVCAYSDDLLVLPSTYIANSKEAEPYAFGFSVAVNAPGLRFICRPSVVHQNAASPMDYPLSARFDETDAMVVFDDVLVPWERVFIHRDPELCNGLYNRTGIGICRRDDPGGNAAVDGADDVPENVRADVRDHSDLRRRRSSRGPLLCGAGWPGGRRRRHLFPSGQRRRQDARQIVPSRLRRRSVVLFGPPAAL